MKLFTAIFLTLGLTTMAQARSLHPDTFAEYSKLVVFDVAEEVEAGDKVNRGELKLNTTRNTVSLRLESHPCPKNPVCMALIKLVAQLDFTLESNYITRCGSTIYHATTEDGDKVFIEDVQNSVCHGSHKNKTFVTLTTVLDSGKKVVSQFEGTTLGKKVSPEPKPKAKLVEGRLVNMNIDKQDERLKTVSSGDVSVDLNKSEIKLTLWRHINCPPNRICKAFMPAPHIVKVPLTLVRQGGCNVTIYEGSLDKRPVDGNLEKLSVVDKSSSICEVLLPEDRMIEVEYDTVTAGMDGTVGVYKSTFTGSRTR